MRIRHLGVVRWLLARLVLFAVALTCVFVLVYVLTVRTLEGRLLGDASLRGALLTGSSLAGTTERVLNVISVASLLAAVATVTVIALVRLQRLPGLAAVAILVGSNASTLLLKAHILVRPDLGADEIAPATLNSLPSGHATAAYSTVVALMFVLPPRWRLATAAFGTVYATITGLATMSAGWHRAGDSIAAFLLVGVWGMVAAAALVIFADSHVELTRSSTSSETAFQRWLEVASVGGVALGVTLGLVLTALPPLRDSTVGSATAFVAGGFLIAGTSTGVLIAVLSALNHTDLSAPHGDSLDLH